MWAQAIKQIVDEMPPGTLIELRITVPPLSLPKEPEPEAPDPAGQEWSLEAVVEWVRREHGAEGLKLREWARCLTGISERALKRAAMDGQLVTHSKPTGRDHGARIASPDAMLAFLRAERYVLQ